MKARSGRTRAVACAVWCGALMPLGTLAPLALGVTVVSAQVPAAPTGAPATPKAMAKPAPAAAAKPPAAGVAKPAAQAKPAAASASTAAMAPSAAGPASSIAGVSLATAPKPTPAALAAFEAKPCDALVRRMPNLNDALCQAAQMQPSGARSVNGYPLFQRDISARLEDHLHTDQPKPRRRPRVLVIGGIHGDELSSTSLAFHWIALAVDTGGDMDWRFVPAVNPDGLLQPRPSRTNARGVDLNRNFPTPGWVKDAPEYWAKRTKKDPRRYPGPAALSEPETRFLQDTMDRWKPDLIVSVHAPYGVLDYDGPSIPPERLGRLFLDRVGIFPGSLGHYGGVHRGVPVVTIELPSAIRTPTEAEMRQMWLDLLRWIGERLSPTER